MRKNNCTWNNIRVSESLTNNMCNCDDLQAFFAFHCLALSLVTQSINWLHNRTAES